MREHYEVTEKRSRGKTIIPRLHMQCPKLLEYVYDRFFDIRASCRPGEPIPFSELKAYSEMTGTELKPREVKLIKKLDFAYLSTLNGSNNSKVNGSSDVLSDDDD